MQSVVRNLSHIKQNRTHNLIVLVFAYLLIGTSAFLSMGVNLAKKF